MHLTVQAVRPQALVAVRLNDVAPDGAATRVSVGLLNLTHRDSHQNPTPLVPRQTFRTVVDLDDIAPAFAPGHRIGEALSTV